MALCFIIIGLTFMKIFESKLNHSVSLKKHLLTFFAESTRSAIVHKVQKTSK